MQQVDPFTSLHWNERVLAAPQASVFHTVNWLQVLQASYGYQPYYFACFKEQQLAILLAFVEVKSWINGVRGVSLPFSDYCEPISNRKIPYPELLAPVVSMARQRQWNFLEIKGGDTLFPDILPYTFYYRHVLALQGGEREVFSGLRSNYRAKIRKARGHDLTVAIRHSPEAMAEYYQLHCLTRKRHGLPPQPAAFFQKIQEYIIAQNLGFVILVSQNGKKIAGAVFFTFSDRALYKFGASDISYQHLYPNYLLFWHAIQSLCRSGYKELCFGRSDPSNQGLVQFKEGWGTVKSQISYYKYDLKDMSFVQNLNRSEEFGISIWKKIPVPLLKLAGSVLYRHMG
jgi:hypothetical protein